MVSALRLFSLAAAVYVDIFRSTYSEIPDIHLDLAIEYFIDGLTEDVRRLVLAVHLEKPYSDMESVFKVAMNHGYVIESGSLAKNAPAVIAATPRSSSVVICNFCKKTTAG